MTRCSVNITDSGDVLRLYRHCDGGLKAAGKVVKAVLYAEDTEYTAKRLIDSFLAANADFEEVERRVGDASYEYNIDIQDRKHCKLTVLHYGDEVYDEDFEII